MDLSALQEAASAIRSDLSVSALQEAASAIRSDLSVSALQGAASAIRSDLSVSALQGAASAIRSDLSVSALQGAAPAIRSGFVAINRAVTAIGPAMKEAWSIAMDYFSATNRAFSAIRTPAMKEALSMAADCFSAINRAVSVMNTPAMQRAAAGLAAMNILPDPSAYLLPDPIKYAGLRPTSLRPPNEVSILSFRSVVERFPETVIDEIGNDEDSIRQEDRVILSDLGIPFCSVQLQASYPDDSIDLMAKHVLTVTERFLRVFVTERLQSLYGPRWFELRVPNCLLKRWRSLEARGQRETGRRYPIIQYS